MNKSYKVILLSKRFDIENNITTFSLYSKIIKVYHVFVSIMMFSYSKYGKKRDNQYNDNISSRHLREDI